MNTIDEFLVHFGVKGMKWGVRKERESSPRPKGVDKPTVIRTDYHTTQIIVSSSKPEKRETTFDADRKKAVIIDVKTSSNSDGEKLIGRKLRPNENTWEIKTQNREQYIADTMRKQKRNAYVEGALDAAWVGYMIDRYILQSDMETDDVDDFLEHYGVKGMKWGIRRNRSRRAGGAAPAERSPEAQRAHDTLQLINKKGIGAATNEDLQNLQQRIKLEMKYKELFPKKKSAIDYGAEVVKRVLIPIAEQQAKSYLNNKSTLLINGKQVVEELELGKHSPGYGRHLKR